MRTLDHKNITETAEWAFLVDKLGDISRDYTSEMIAAASIGETARVQFLAGKVQMINELTNMPEAWMPTPKE